jgi:hypothetical protein
MNLERLALAALIAEWARAVDRIERGDVGMRDGAPDYLEDLAVRHEISRRIRARPVTADTRETMAELDGIYRDATVESAECVPGMHDAAAQGWTAAREWYYWRRLR